MLKNNLNGIAKWLLIFIGAFILCYLYEYLRYLHFAGVIATLLKHGEQLPPEFATYLAFGALKSEAFVLTLKISVVICILIRLYAPATRLLEKLYFMLDAWKERRKH